MLVAWQEAAFSLDVFEVFWEGHVALARVNLKVHGG